MAIKFRKGDIVSIQGTVQFNQEPEDDHIKVEIPDAIGNPVWVKPEAATVVRQKIDVGDMIWTDSLGKELPGKVISIHAGSAWIDVDGVMYTYFIGSLKRAES